MAETWNTTANEGLQNNGSEVYMHAIESGG